MKPDELEDDPWPMPDDEDEGEVPRRESRHSRHRSVPDLFRRAFENTVGSVQSTQSVSREALHAILHTTDRTRRELVRLVAGEVGDFLRHTDLASEVTKVLTSVQADVHLSIGFKRNPEGGLDPEITQKGSEKRREAPPREGSSSRAKVEGAAPKPREPSGTKGREGGE